MASMQIPSVFDKAIVEKYKKQIAENNASLEWKNKGAVQGNITTTIGYLFNYHEVYNTNLQMVDLHHWSGGSGSYNPFPATLYYDVPVVQSFIHHGVGGSSAGVVYVDGSRKWVVAFDRINSKVYVETGPIGAVNWQVVKAKLDQSGAKSEYEDPVLGSKAYAEFTPKHMFAIFRASN